MVALFKTDMKTKKIEKGYYMANAFNLGDILIDIKNHQRRENVVFYPKIFRYNRVVFRNVFFWINEFGSGVSLERIPNATTLEEAKNIYNNGDEYYYPTYNRLINTINSSFGAKISDTDISFIVEITEVKNESKYAQISILAGPYFDFYLAVFIESLFILQLCRLLERKLASLVNDKKSYNSQKILTEFASSLLIVENPQGYLPNHTEAEYMEEMYAAWKIRDLISALRSKYDFSLNNYKFFLEYDEKRQNALTTLLLGSITVFSINQTIPIFYESFPFLKAIPFFSQQNVLLFFTVIALAIAGYTFHKYYIAEFIDKIVFKVKNNKIQKLLR